MTDDSPKNGSFHLRLQSGDGYVSRQADMTGMTNIRLQFWAKVFSFETGDQADILVSTDGVNWTSVLTFTDADDDNIYTLWDLDLGAFQGTSTFSIAFDANMGATNDQWFIDDVLLIGQAP